MNKNSYDIIGDIHGRFDKLEMLLKALGYEHNGTYFAHSDPQRKAIFLGDLIDPKNGEVPNGTREVLHTVKGMVDHGNAACILGNHEYNFVAYRTKSRDHGEFIRPHDEKNDRMHDGTESAFFQHPMELETVFIPWLQTLPFYLDLPEIRAVHACWDPKSLDLLKDKTLGDLEFLEKSGIEGTPEYEAVETVLKGQEVKLPDGCSFEDHTGTARTHIRVRWWETDGDLRTAQSLVFPYNSNIPKIPIPARELKKLAGYPKNEKPVFIGHYYKTWMENPYEDHLPETHNIFCLDFSAATDGPLAVYQWRYGDRNFAPENLHLIHPTSPFGLISAYLSNPFGDMGQGPETWTTLVNSSDEPPILFDLFYYPIVSQALNLIDYRDLSFLWLRQTPEGKKFQETIDEGFLPDPHEIPSYDSMNLDMTETYLWNLIEHGHQIDTTRYSPEFSEESFYEDEEYEVDDSHDHEESKGPWTLGLVENSDTADLNAEVTPMTGYQYETQEQAKNAAKGLNREASLEEGMFADLIIVIPPES